MCCCRSVQVGTTPRLGTFGACFDPNSNGLQILAARPGKRLWLADALSGKVLSTLKYVVLPIAALNIVLPLRRRCGALAHQ